MAKNSRKSRIALSLGAAFAFVGAFGTASAEWKVADDKARTTLDNIQKQNQVKGAAYNPSTKRSLNPYSTSEYPLKNEFPARAEDVGVAERCPANSKNPAKVAQNKICTEMVTWENRQYNYVIETLKVTKLREEELQKIYEERSGIGADQPGALQANTNRLLALQAQQQIDAINTSAMLGGYSAIVSRLKENIALEAKKTMDDKSTSGLDGIIDVGIQGGMLEAALQIARTRDR